MSILFWSLRQVQKATTKLPPEPSWVEFPPETNFKNGYLDFTGGKLYPHSNTRFVKHTNDVQYDPNEVLTFESQQFICESLRHNINCMRTAGYRCIVLQEFLQTVYYLVGFSGCGKTT